MARVEAAEDMFSKQSWFLNSSEFNRLCKYRRGFAFSCFLVIIFSCMFRSQRCAADHLSPRSNSGFCCTKGE